MGSSGRYFCRGLRAVGVQSSNCRSARALNWGVTNRRWPIAEASVADTHSSGGAIGARLSGRPRPGRPISLGYLPSVEHGLDNADERCATPPKRAPVEAKKEFFWPQQPPGGGIEGREGGLHISPQRIF